MDEQDWIVHDLLGKTVHIEVDRPMGYRHGDIVYPINYGYIPGMIAGDGEEQDAYILGVSQPLSAFDGRAIGIIRRRNDREDKLVVAPEDMVFHQGQIVQAVSFQEQYFDSYVIPLFHKSCGVIPYRVNGGKKEYLLVYEQASKIWSFPKGHMEPGETEAETALRELSEETGLAAVLDINNRICLEYPLSSTIRKQVVFFSGEVQGDPVPREGEIESCRWVTGEELRNYLHPDTYQACSPFL